MTEVDRERELLDADRFGDLAREIRNEIADLLSSAFGG